MDVLLPGVLSLLVVPALVWLVARGLRSIADVRLRRADAEIAPLAEEVCLFLERGETERARSRLREAGGPLASVLESPGVSFGDPSLCIDEGGQRAARIAVWRIGDVPETVILLIFAILCCLLTLAIFALLWVMVSQAMMGTIGLLLGAASFVIGAAIAWSQCSRIQTARDELVTRMVAVIAQIDAVARRATPR